MNAEFDHHNNKAGIANNKPVIVALRFVDENNAKIDGFVVVVVVVVDDDSTLLLLLCCSPFEALTHLSGSLTQKRIKNLKKNKATLNQIAKAKKKRKKSTYATAAGNRPKSITIRHDRSLLPVDVKALSTTYVTKLATNMPNGAAV